MKRIAVASGKGGVGKSTVALNLALALAEHGREVGLLDADFYGPDIPRMIGLVRTKQARFLNLWDKETADIEPVEKSGIKFMSVGFLLGENQSLSLQSGLIDLLLVRLLHNVAWGDLDYLLIDLPPGTADLQQQLMRRTKLDGVLLVVTPQDVAHLDAKKVIDLCGRMDVPVIGAVENMSGFICPTCGERTEVFPPVSHERSIWALGVQKLAEFPLDPALDASSFSGLAVTVGDR
jgi:ATP-binding protein involved in chromosome partitioning